MSARLLANGFGESGSELCGEHMMVKTTWTARLELTLQFFYLVFIDILPVKQQPVLNGNVQLSFQFYTHANVLLNVFMFTASLDV